MRQPGDKRYIGDGVYVEWENDMIHLTTENGVRVLSSIYLDHDVWWMLKEWVKEIEQQEATA